MLLSLGVLVGAPVAACNWCKNKSSKEHMKNRNKVPRYAFIRRLFFSLLVEKKEDKEYYPFEKIKSLCWLNSKKNLYLQLQPRLIGVPKVKLILYC